MLVSHGAVPLPDALFEDHGQLVESQAEEFRHPAGPCAGFLGVVNKDAIVSPGGLLAMANLPLHWGKSSHTHTVSVSHVLDNQSGLPAVRKHGGKQPIILINNHHWQEKLGGI